MAIDLHVNEAEFWKWCDSKGMPVEEIKRRWGTGFAQKMNEINWQNKKIDDAQEKLTNILQSDEIGKTISSFLQDKNREELKKM